MYGVSELECVCRGYETDAGRRPAARPFVQDAQSAVRLPESRSRRSRDRLSDTLGVLNEWHSCRSTDSVGLAAAANTRDVSYDIQCIRRHALTYLVVATPTPAHFAFLSAGYHLQAG